MTDVEKMYNHLMRTVRTTFPQYLTQPFTVGELYQTILPYRLHRRELGLETNVDYEHTLLELIGSDSKYLTLDDRLRDVLAADRAASKSDPARIREFASSQVTLNSQAAVKAEDTPARASTSTPTLTRTAARMTNPPVQDAPVSPPRTSKSVVVPEEGGTCQFCKGALPGGRHISYCPHCGQNITVAHCPACGSELEKDWQFCVTCGRSAA